MKSLAGSCAHSGLIAEQALISRILFSVSLVAIAASPSELMAGRLFGGDHNKIYSIDVTTGVRSTLQTFPLQYPPGRVNFSGLAYNENDHFLYATYAELQRSGSARNSDYTAVICRIDMDAWTLESITLSGHLFGPLDAIHGLEYDGKRNVFWGTAPASNEVLNIDAQTFEVTSVGQFSRPALISGLAYDHHTDTLYGVEDFAMGENVSQLVSIDLATLEISPIGPPGLGLGLNDLDSLAFDVQKRVLYSINDQQEPYQQMVQIDPSTGLASTIGSRLGGSIAFYQGLAYVVPEPEALFLAMLFGAISVLSRRLR